MRIPRRTEPGKPQRNDIENLLTLCGAHHRAVHHGTLVIAGEAAGNVRFHHCDGREYGSIEDPLALDVRARVFAALRGLGFRAGEADAALAELVRDGEAAPTAEVLLREALLRLTPDCAQSRYRCATDWRETPSAALRPDELSWCVITVVTPSFCARTVCPTYGRAQGAAVARKLTRGSRGVTRILDPEGPLRRAVDAWTHRRYAAGDDGGVRLVDGQ